MKISNQICNIKLIELLTIGLVLAAMPAVAQVKKTNFGLGTPKTSGIGGAVRSGVSATCPRIGLISPLSGSRTLSSQPTLYWYLEKSNLPVEVTVILRDRDDNNGVRVFSAKGETKGAGLFSFSLPKSAKPLTVGQAQRWDLRVQSADCSDLTVASAAIKLDSNPTVLAAIAKTKTDLQKAKIYSEGGYWFDAISAYDQWLKANPQDQTTLRERNAMIVNGFQEYAAVKGEPNSSLDFIKLIPTKIEKETANMIVLSELKI